MEPNAVKSRVPVSGLSQDETLCRVNPVNHSEKSPNLSFTLPLESLVFLSY